MKISYNTLDNTEKQFKLVDGVYSIENDRLTKWMWTAQEFSGVVNNIEYISYKTDFISLKYYPKLKRAILTTENYEDITNLSTLMINLGLKETLYNLKTPNS
jgi:hypothetical protein